MDETTVKDKRKILFVDDEPRILQGLQRMLRGQHKEWKMFFVEGGHEAVEFIKKEKVEVVVSDMRMPKMDGAELLTILAETDPNIVRIILSGHSDKEMVYRSVQIAHQYLSKPCPAEDLVSAITRVFELRDLLNNKELKKLISQIKSLPTLPAIYVKLMNELKAVNCSMQRIAEIVNTDVGMTAKMLQLVNSAFFGLPRHISSPVQAVTLLGLETVKALILSIHIFSEFDDSIAEFDSDRTRRHSLSVAQIARVIAEKEKLGKNAADHAYLAGLLHDCGKLILASKLKEEYIKILKHSKKANIPTWQAEKESFNASHAEIGAYLMGIWGLPDPIVEAIAFHHKPSLSSPREFNILSCLHIADILSKESCENRELDGGLDMKYIKEIGYKDKLEPLRAACAELCYKGEEDE